MSSHKTLSKIACTLSLEVWDSGAGGAKSYVTSVGDVSSSLFESLGEASSLSVADEVVASSSVVFVSSCASAANRDNGEEWKLATFPPELLNIGRVIDRWCRAIDVENSLVGSGRRWCHRLAWRRGALVWKLLMLLLAWSKPVFEDTDPAIISFCNNTGLSRIADVDNNRSRRYEPGIMWCFWWIPPDDLLAD